jgi:hypothetical protein
MRNVNCNIERKEWKHVQKKKKEGDPTKTDGGELPADIKLFLNIIKILSTHCLS